QEKDTQIKQMQKLLDQQQQLTLQANQQIEKLQEQLQLAYTEEPEEEELTSVNKENNNAITTEKKWWKFW
ncbi:replication protein B, partial [Enterococcus faecium]